MLTRLVCAGNAMAMIHEQRKRRMTSSCQAAAPGIEMLVHNCAHGDLILQLQSGEEVYKARPRFNQFQPVSEAILGYIDEMQVSALRQ